MKKATLGGGCFWCTEAVFQKIEGVEKIVAGYAGGAIKNPTYEEICSGLTGHAEVVQIIFDERKITYEDLLEIFWKTHDPTTLNRQGNDVGTQYRSIIFYHDSDQMEAATFYKEKLNNSGVFDAKIVTEVVPYEEFYPAEDYHQNYFRNNESQPYCSFVIKPKVKKVEEIFASKLKKPKIAS